MGKIANLAISATIFFYKFLSFGPIIPQILKILTTFFIITCHPMVGTGRANAIERLERAGKESASAEQPSTDASVRLMSA